MTAAEFAGVTWLLLPLLGGGIFHGLCMRYDWMPRLKRPIDGGRTWRRARWFGDNKTWRGPVALGIGAALFIAAQAAAYTASPAIRSVALIDYTALWCVPLGFLIGFAAMLSELPNSFLKRQAGVTPGQPATGTLRILCYLGDQVDILLGTWLVLALVIDVRWTWVAYSLVGVAVLHQAMSSVGYCLGMRKTPR